MKTEHDIEILLTESRPILDTDSRAQLWSKIEGKLATARPVRSPFLFSFIETRTMVPALLVITLLVSTGGVALASETARPGDFLFPVERAIETARLKVAFSPQTRESLIRMYSEERLTELREIIQEETRLKKVSENSPLFIASTTLRSLAIEADVFTDTTLVKVELNEGKTTFNTDADTRDKVVEEVLIRFPGLTKGQVESSLDFENENRASRAKERGAIELSSKGSVRVGGAVTVALTFIEESENDDEDTTQFLKELRAEIEGLNIKIDEKRVKARGNEKSRFEWKINDARHNEEGETEVSEARVRIEEKDGQVRINLKEDETWSNDDDSEVRGAKTVIEENDDHDTNTKSGKGGRNN